MLLGRCGTHCYKPYAESQPKQYSERKDFRNLLGKYQLCAVNYMQSFFTLQRLTQYWELRFLRTNHHSKNNMYSSVL